jgi:hypothetical protein
LKAGIFNTILRTANMKGKKLERIIAIAKELGKLKG